MIIEFTKETILPNADIDDPKAFCWFKPGVYEFNRVEHKGRILYLMPDTPFGAGQDYFHNVGGYGGVRIIKEEI